MLLKILYGLVDSLFVRTSSIRAIASEETLIIFLNSDLLISGCEIESNYFLQASFAVLAIFFGCECTRAVGTNRHFE
jgi:hypothetical protein